MFPGWWQVVAALVLQAASSASVFTAYSVVAVPLQEAFEPSRMMLMMGVTVAALAAGTLGPPVGMAVDRYSVRLLMLLGTCLLGGGFFVLSMVQSMDQVVVVYLVPLALGCVLTGPVASSALLARWFSRRRGLAMSLAASGAAVGGLLIPPLLQALIDAFEWRAALRIYGIGLFLVSAPLVGLLVINHPAQRGLGPDGDQQHAADASTAVRETGLGMGHFLRDANFWIFAIVLGCLLSAPMGLVSNLLPLVLEKDIGAQQGALLLSITAGAGFLGKLASGIIADRVDFRVMLAAIALAVALAMFGYADATAFPALVAYSALLGFMQGGVVPLWSLVLAREYGAANMGRSMGLMGLMIMPFTLVAAPLFGWVHDRFGSYDPVLLAYALVVALSCVLIAMLRAQPGARALSAEL